MERSFVIVVIARRSERDGRCGEALACQEPCAERTVSPSSGAGRAAGEPQRTPDPTELRGEQLAQSTFQACRTPDVIEAASGEGPATRTRL
jgi:hypothetical protein